MYAAVTVSPTGRVKTWTFIPSGNGNGNVALRHYMDSDRQTRGATTGNMARGFSLIEVMIAMAVLVVGLLGGIAVIAVASANDGRSKLHSTAILLAQSTMEKIAAIPAAAGIPKPRLRTAQGRRTPLRPPCLPRVAALP